MRLAAVPGALQGLQHELADCSSRDARGGGIDRFEEGDLVHPFGGQNVVGMGDLQVQAEALDLAADDPLGA